MPEGATKTAAPARSAAPARAGGGASRTAAPASRRAASGGQVPAGPAVKLSGEAAKDPRFKKALDKLQERAAKARKHEPASKKAADAQAAALPPPNEKLAGAKANQVDTMQSADTKKPDNSSFLNMLRAEIQKVTPKKTEDGKDFMKGDDKQQLKGAMTGNIDKQKEEAAGGVKAASTQPPDQSKVTGKEVTALPAEPAPEQPAPLGSAEAMPAPKPADDLSLEKQKGKPDSDSEMEKNEITPTQMQKANDPRFTKVLTTKGEADKQAKEGPTKYRATEGKVLTEAGTKAVGDEKQGLTTFKNVKGAAGNKVKSRQQLAKEKEEKARKEVTDHIEGIYSRTKAAVDKKLESVETEVTTLFDQGADAAVFAMKDYVETRFDDRYSGISGAALWLKDKLVPLPDKVKAWFDQAYARFQQDLDRLVVRIAALVEQRLAEAKAMIAAGQKEISEYVKGLAPNLQEVGKAAEKEMAGRFDEMRQGVDEKKNDLAQKLAQRYKEAQDKGAAALKEMKDAHKSLVEKVIDAIAEIVEILKKFRDRVMGMLKKGKQTLDLIIADPIGFLSNLLDAIKMGINRFKDNIWEHLKAGFFKWLFGSLADAGLTLPKDFSLPSILQLVLQVLGLTYARLRAKAVKLIGERNVTLIEKVFELLQALWNGGPAALWEKLKEFLSDLKEQVMGAIQDWVITTIVKAAVTKLATMFNPVGAIIQAIITIYNTVMFFIERMNQILDFVEAVINSVHKIATGDLGSAASWIEQALARTIPIIIGFLARLLGISGITDKIVGFIKKIQDKVDNAVDKVIAKIVQGIGKLFGRNTQTTNDPQHDAKLQAGLAALDQEDARYKKDGQIQKEDAEKVAIKIKREHSIFKSITVVDGGDTWDYEYVASKGKKKGDKKAAGNTEDLKKAKAQFRRRLFTREELQDILKVSKTTAIERVSQWKKDGVLFQLATTTFDTFTQYTFDEVKSGEREIISENKREMYGYKNPAKDSTVGLIILSKGLRTDSPAYSEDKKGDATYHQTKARYDSKAKGSGFKNFKYDVAILGHKGEGASGHWNTKGHKKPRLDNQTWNNNSDNYHGPEHKTESAASGASAQRYRIPSKAAKSHESWLE